MDRPSIFHQHAQAAEGRREALQWLARRLNWERRLTELRPGVAEESKQAA